LVVVDELGSDSLIALGHKHMPHVPPLTLDLLEAPDLSSNPAIVEAFSDTLDEFAFALNEPALLEKIVLDLVKSDETRAALDVTEQPIRVLAVIEVETAVLLGTCQARGRLGDVNMGDDVGGSVGCLGRGIVLVNIEGDCSHADSLASEVSNALEGEDRL
jgi:hypothetical protein